MSTEIPFIKDICRYFADNSDFYFGSDDSLPVGKTKWLKAGELPRDTDGVYAIQDPSPEADRETGVQYHTISFWARNKNTSTAYEHAMEVYNFFHQKHDLPTDNYYVFQAFGESLPIDQDRDAEGGKLIQVTIQFITRYLIS